MLQHVDIQVMEEVLVREEVPVREISHANRRRGSPARMWGGAGVFPKPPGHQPREYSLISMISHR